MTPDAADELGRQETATLEFKRDAADRDALRKEICALATTCRASAAAFC